MTVIFFGVFFCAWCLNGYTLIVYLYGGWLFLAPKADPPTSTLTLILTLALWQ